MSDRGRALPSGLALAALLGAPLALGAQRGPDCVAALRAFAPAAVVGQAWPAPLDRVVRLGAAVVPLREALGLVAARASIRISYSPDLVPVDRMVCVPGAELTVGAALAGLLDGVGVAPVVAGDDQVVLAPARTAAGASATPPIALRTGRLERVVVTGTATGGSERSSPLALAVVEGPALERGSGVQSAAQLLGAAVPGVWLWTQSPGSPLARYGSIRGASSFGLSAPKVYIDGIEMANPLLLAQIDAGRVQRIEVIRGPQGAALYGADAISGVVNVVTRHEAGTPGAAGELAATAGTTSSSFAGDALAQSHAASLRIGTGARSASIGGSAATLGAYVPGASSRQLSLQAEGRRVGAWTVATGIARWYSLRADAPASPLLAALDSTGGREALNAYTLGSTVTITPSARWTHAITAGVDGYRLAGLPSDGIPAPSSTDSALRDARAGADRVTLRLSSTLGAGEPTTRRESLTIALEHSTAREQTNLWGSRIEPHSGGGGPGPGGGGGGMMGTEAPATVAWWSNTGLLAQGQLALRNALFLSGGARLEHIGVPGASEIALLPMLGSAWAHDVGAATVKLRAAYGRGIRPARTVARGGTWMEDRYGTLVSLSPEEQSGVEVGVDLLWGRWGGLHATRYDQRASGLVQPVAFWSQDTTSGSGEHHMAYQLQNVGAIDNRGWELQATVTPGRGALSLGASLAIVDSRVHRVAPDYGGDLQPGDRMLEVPARTFGVTAGWTTRRLSTSWSLTRASDWINYDRLALAQAVADAQASGGTIRPPVGTQLRAFWRSYDGVTRLGGRLTLNVIPRVGLTLVGENLLGRQTGEPDNLTVVPGRTIRLGVKTSF